MILIIIHNHTFLIFDNFVDMPVTDSTCDMSLKTESHNNANFVTTRCHVMAKLAPRWILLFIDCFAYNNSVDGKYIYFVSVPGLCMDIPITFSLCYPIPGPCFTNNFPIIIQIQWKFCVDVNQILAVRSLQNFAHATTAQSCSDHCIRILMRAKWNGHQIWNVAVNHKWNGPLVN